MKWEAKSLMLFLNRNDTFHIPKEFFFNLIKSRSCYCPGPVHILYVKAFVELIWILLFLGFVMMVVLAFADANQISGTNQTMTTLAGGFLPLAFKKCFQKSHTGLQVDTNNMSWKATLDNKIKSYSERWAISDLKSIEYIGSSKFSCKRKK